MKKLYKGLLGLGILILVVFISANATFSASEQNSGGRAYRVEVNRLVKEIEQTGLPPADLSQYQYVYGIHRCTGDEQADFNINSDYVIRQVNNVLYRFDYRSTFDNTKEQMLLNLFLGIMTLILLGVLLFIRQKILRPFSHLEELPYELAKGNLATPLPESEYRLFGRFLWGVNALRETLEQQKRRELALHKEKKTLLLSLSHDIKTPLSAIKLYSKVLSKGLYADPEKQRQIALQIDKKADELEGYISQITAASGEDFLSLDVTIGEFYLSQLVEQVDHYYSDKLSLLKTEFHVAGYQNCLLRGDLDRSVEVIQNLMENATKYGDGTRIALEFSKEEDCMLVSVKNSGCTLSNSELPHIFDSFWRGSNAQGQQGSGLGLYICRQLMHKMNGEIFAEANGTELRVTAVFPMA